KKVLMFEMRLWTPYKLEGVDNGIAIYGTDGMVQIGRWGAEGSGFKVFDNAGKLVKFEKETGGDGHAKNFIECVRSRQAPNAEIEIGHLSSVHCHLGNIVARTGRTLRLNGNPSAVLNDSEATKLARRDYRKHWATPKGVQRWISADAVPKRPFHGQPLAFVDPLFQFRRDISFEQSELFRKCLWLFRVPVSAAVKLGSLIDVCRVLLFVVRPLLVVPRLHRRPSVDQRLSNPPPPKGGAEKTPDLRECRGLRR